MNKPRDIIFRIPKTASYTMRNIAEREFRGTPSIDTNFPLLGPQAWDGFLARLAALPVEERAACRSVVGHMKFGVHEHLPGSSRYITFLREPVARFLSYYGMLRRQGLVPADHTFDATRPDWNLPPHESFTWELDNGQVRALANTDWDLPFGSIGEEHLQLAIVNIERHFALVGLTEHFDLSLMLLRRLCGWRWHFYVPKNITPRGKAPAPLAPELVAEIRKLNQYDLRLYAYAQDRFWAEVRRGGPAFQVVYAAFLAGNAVHRGIHAVWYPLKRRGRSKTRSLSLVH